MKELWDERYQPADDEIVKRKAAKFARRNRSARLDAEEVSQELATHVFQNTHRHDHARGSREKFVSKVVKNKLLNLIEARTAKKRDDRRNIEYDQSPEGSLIDGSATAAQIDLQLELQVLAASMPAEMCQVYELMLQQFGEADIREHLRIGRQRVRTLMRKVEDRIREANLGRYVGAQPNDQ